MPKDKPGRQVVTTYHRIPSIYMRCPHCMEDQGLVMVFDPISRTSKKCDGRFYSACGCRHQDVLLTLTRGDNALRAFHGAEGREDG